MATQPFRDAERKQLSMLAAVEKKTLIWLAQRMPAWVNSDHLTLLGFVAMFVAGLCYWAASWDRRALIGVILALAVNWFGDSLDGTLARVRNRLRPRYGFYVDHITDAIGTFFLIGGLGLSGYMSPNIALGLLIAYFMLSIEVYLTTYTIGTFHLSFWSFGPTELRVLLCIGNIALFYRPEVGTFGTQVPAVRHRRRCRHRRHGADAGVVGGAPHSPALRGRASAVTPLAVRWLKFNLVGAMGIGVQMGAFALLFGLLHLNYLVATGARRGDRGAAQFRLARALHLEAPPPGRRARCRPAPGAFPRRQRRNFHPRQPGPHAPVRRRPAHPSLRRRRPRHRAVCHAEFRGQRMVRLPKITAYPHTRLGYDNSGAFLQSRCWPFYFDPTSQNRESDSITALVSKLLAVRRKGEA